MYILSTGSQRVQVVGVPDVVPDQPIQSLDKRATIQAQEPLVHVLQSSLLIKKGINRIKMVELFNEKGDPASLQEVVTFWLERYEGMEHLCEGGRTSPETWYTVSAILRRCLEQIQDKKQRG